MRGTISFARAWKGVVVAVCAVMLLCCTGTAWADGGRNLCISVDRETGQGSSGTMSVVHETAGEGIGDSARLLASEAMPARSADASRASGTFDAVLGGTVHQGQAFEMLTMVNGERARLGLEPLQWDAALEEAAMQRAAETFIPTVGIASPHSLGSSKLLARTSHTLRTLRHPLSTTCGITLRVIIPIW